ncbi:MAG: hypothetical protein NZL85_10070, partial [Fimbriimonadales bacterium]|nr:hypothetical protein [Fimbriimonadales bacterium]
MQRLKLLLLEHELLITIGIFGLTQMVADLLADMHWDLVAAIMRIIGIVLLVGILLFSFWRRPMPLQVPLLFVEENDRELARQKFERWVKAIRLEKSVKVLDRCTPVRHQELVIQLRADVRNSTKKADWRKVLEQLIREWDEEVDERLRRWL